MSRAPLAIALAACAAVIAHPEPAAACSCMMPRIQISPEGAGAPTNATVVAWIPRGGYGARGAVTLTLREKLSGAPVAVDYRTAGSADVGVVEMIPRAPLKPGTAYAVIEARAGGGVDEVGGFVTGDARATRAPAWNGVVNGGYFQDKPVCCMCMTDDPYILLELSADPHGPADRKLDAVARYAVWVADASGKLDYKRRPVTYLPGGSARLWLGHPSTCAPDDFKIPRRKALRLGIRPVDLAGNLGTASEIVLDTLHPRRRR